MSSGFISESVIEQKKAERQSEWEKVRKADDPEEAPPEPEVLDSRSLFDRLQEQKNKKQEEWDEAHKLKNQIRGIDDDEADFLDVVDNIKSDLERKRRIEEKRELEDYQKKQAALHEKMLEDKKLEIAGRPPNLIRRQTSSSSSSSGRVNSQSKLLAKAIVKKRSAPKEEEEETSAQSKKVAKEPPNQEPDKPKSSGLGALAGLGDYSSSSEEEDS